MSNISLSDQITGVSTRTGIAYTTSQEILRGYGRYVRYMVDKGHSTTYLGLFDLRNKNLEESRTITTYAYQARIVADELGLSHILVKSVLDELREMLITDVVLGRTYTIYNLAQVSNIDGRVHIKGSTTLPKDVRVHCSRWFRSEFTGRKDGIA